MRAKLRIRRDEMPHVEQFGQPLVRIMTDASISRMARLAYCILSGATDSRTGECRMSITTLAQHLGMRRQNAERYVKELDERGIIVRLSKNTQPSRWRVPVGGVVNDLPPQRGKLDMNLLPQQGKNLPPTGGTFIDSHIKAFDSDPQARVITEEEESFLISAQARLDERRVKDSGKGVR